MKGVTLVCVFVLAGLALSCGGSAVIKSQEPAAPALGTYRNVYVGWLDFGEGNWKQYGFKNPRDWNDAITELNVKSLQAYCRNRLSGRTVTGARARGGDAPAKTDLYVKLHLKKHVIGSGLNRIQYLHLDVRYVDMATGRTKYSADVVVDSSGFGLGNYTFEGQLNFAMGNLADFISSKF